MLHGNCFLNRTQLTGEEFGRLFPNFYDDTWSWQTIHTAIKQSAGVQILALFAIFIILALISTYLCWRHCQKQPLSSFLKINDERDKFKTYSLPHLRSTNSHCSTYEIDDLYSVLSF